MRRSLSTCATSALTRPGTRRASASASSNGAITPHSHLCHPYTAPAARRLLMDPEKMSFAAARYLEEELQRRYRDAAPSTLTVLQQRCELVAAELATAEQNLASASDVAALRRAGELCTPALKACPCLPQPG